MENSIKWHTIQNRPWTNDIYFNQKSPAILYCTTNSKFGTLKEGTIDNEEDWRRYVEKYSIKYWALQKCILIDIEIDEQADRIH